MDQLHMCMCSPYDAHHHLGPCMGVPGTLCYTFETKKNIFGHQNWKAKYINKQLFKWSLCDTLVVEVLAEEKFLKTFYHKK